jgi:CubicO group peptidase (beta-lactamase class C family)
MRKLLLIVLLAGGVAVGVPLAQSSRAAHPPTAAYRLDPARLARLDRVLDQYVQENRIAGAVALVLQDGKPAYERAVGWRDKESGLKMTADSIFRIASQTKAITSTAVLMLVEEGKIGLTDPVSRYIPSFAKTTVATKKADGTVDIVPAKRQVTITDLLTHTAGISYGTSAEVAQLYEAKGLGPAAGFGWYTADKDEPVCQTMERLPSVPFVAQPGEEWVYGYNTDILGCVVERASGVPLDEFFRTRILGPLGMNDTYFFLPADKQSRLVTVYMSTPENTAVRAPDGARGQGHYAQGPRKNFAGGAGLVSTARDYATFLEMIRNGGELNGTRLLAPRTVALMTHNQSGLLHNGPAMGFGLGFETTERVGGNGLEPVGSFGWGGAYGSVYRVDPSARLTLVLMLNQIPNATDIRTKFQTLVHQAVVP